VMLYCGDFNYVNWDVGGDDESGDVDDGGVGDDGYGGARWW